MEFSATLPNLFESFERDHFALYYKGGFPTDIVMELIDLIEYNTLENLSTKFQKRTSILITESIQNIEKYGDAENVEDSVFVCHRDGFITIKTVNLINYDQKESLKVLIESINKLEGEELEAHFNEVANSTVDHKKNSAGLGLIQMKRKAKRNLTYSFDTLNRAKIKFNLELSFPTTEDSEELNSINESQITKENQELEKILGHVYSKNSGIWYSGKFSNKSMVPILKILRNFLSRSISGFKLDSAQYHVLIEMLQNVSKHNESPENSRGMFLIRKGSYTTYEIFTANPILAGREKHIKDHIDKLLSMSPLELISYTKTKMKEQFELNTESAKIGLPNIIRYSSHRKLKYDFFRNSKKLLFYLETQLN